MFRRGNLIVDRGYILTDRTGKEYCVSLAIDMTFLRHLSKDGILVSALLEEKHQLPIRILYEGADRW